MMARVRPLEENEPIVVSPRPIEPGEDEETYLGFTPPLNATLFSDVDQTTIKSLPLRCADEDGVSWNPPTKEYKPSSWLLDQIRLFTEIVVPAERRGRRTMIDFILIDILLESNQDENGQPIRPHKGWSGNILLSDELAGVVDCIIGAPDTRIKSPRLVMVQAKTPFAENDPYKILAVLYAIIKKIKYAHPLFGVLTNGLVWQFYQMDNQFVKRGRGKFLMWHQSNKYLWEQQSEQVLCILAGMLDAKLYKD